MLSSYVASCPSHAKSIPLLSLKIVLLAFDELKTSLSTGVSKAVEEELPGVHVSSLTAQKQVK